MDHSLLYEGVKLLNQNNEKSIELLLNATELFEKNKSMETPISLMIYFDALISFSKKPCENYEKLFNYYTKWGSNGVYYGLRDDTFEKRNN